jgi:adenine-specific DNA glycosylase
VYHDTVVLWRKTARGVEVLLEQRPATGLWAGLWQPPAIESTTRKRRTLKSLLAELGLPASASRTKPREWVFQTTHRDVCFRIWTSECECSGDANRRWIEVAALHLVGVSNAHRSIVSDILDGVRCASA